MNRIYLLILILDLLLFSTANNVKKIRPRIIGGLEDTTHFLTYVVILEVNYNGGFSHCTGSLISDRLVVTAAHCVILQSDNSFMYGPYTVCSGTSNINDPNRILTKVEKVYVPTAFNYPTSFFADIALLKLATPLDLSNPNLSRLLLPNPITEPGHTDDYAGQTGVVAGYGISDNVTYTVDDDRSRSSSLNGNIATILQYGQSLILNHTSCSIIYSDMQINESQMCAKFYAHNPGHRGICKGDSGGPLIIGNVLIGVVSNGGFECDERYAPTIYTKVAYFIDFIVDAVNDNYSNNKIRSIVLP